MFIVTEYAALTKPAERNIVINIVSLSTTAGMCNKGI